MDLFDLEHPEGTGKLGFRLQKLEVYNWGTFNQKVWILKTDGDTSLLTGDVGSGKSTLVDALLTLLVKPRRVTYNKAADASARERSVLSYVRGYYAQKRTSEGGGKPEALRDTSSYSVILAVFVDDNLGAAVTLAQVFWFKEEARSPERFYVAADKTLSITEHFTNFGADIKLLKRRLATDSYIHVYDEYAPYGNYFCRRFGIKQLQAMDLFQQTVSMKKVDELTGFVRQNMLEIPDTGDDVKNLLGHFRDLDAAHEAVLKAKRQQGMLAPLVAEGDKYLAENAEKTKLHTMLELLKPWIAGQENIHKAAELEQQLITIDRAKQEKAVFDSRLADLSEEIKQLEQAVAQNGGQRLQLLLTEIRQLQEKHLLQSKALENYTKQAAILKLPEVLTENSFIRNRQSLLEKRAIEEARRETLSEELRDCKNNLDDEKEECRRLTEEIISLKQRKSSIPLNFIELRKQICDSLDLAETEMPFVGELIEVKAAENRWEGAIERLLHGFALSMLVPDVHYGEVTEWLERNNIKRRFVYYRVRETGFLQQEIPEDRDRVYGKLNLRTDSSFCDWLINELSSRFDHLCCESMRDFRRADFALSLAGQVKSGGKRHEKDDRHSLNDRSQYVLGFSNLKKVEFLEQEKLVHDTEAADWKKKLQNIQKRQKENEQSLDAVKILNSYEEFSMINASDTEVLLNQKLAEQVGLERENEQLQSLKQLLNEKMQVYKSIEMERDKANTESIRADMLKNQLEEKIKHNKQLIAEAEPELLDKYQEHFKDNYRLALGSELNDGTIKDFADVENRYYKWLSKAEDRQSSKVENLNNNLIHIMEAYQNSFPQETRSIDKSPQAIGEYRKLLEQLELDGLPRFEEKFRELLKENTINQIAMFNGKLNIACRDIEDRINMINQSLSTIDYNPGRYIRIEYQQAADDEIKKFRTKLRACIDSSLSGIDDEQYTETKFAQVKEIIERFRGRAECAESDEKWTQKVIDVRNWYDFAASERWRETDTEYEHYTDSGGKSGGQKEKLAYTILAASLVYNFGLETKDKRIQSFRFVVIDEAFLKSSDDSARFGLELFKKLELQLLVVTPLLKIATIEPYVTHVGFVYQNDEQHCSALRNLTIQELREERIEFEQNN